MYSSNPGVDPGRGGIYITHKNEINGNFGCIHCLGAQGYAAEANATQDVDKENDVTANGGYGVITTSNSPVASGEIITFLVKNSFVKYGDEVKIAILEPLKYDFAVTGLDNGGFNITIRNKTQGQLSEALEIEYHVIFHHDIGGGRTMFAKLHSDNIGQNDFGGSEMTNVSFQEGVILHGQFTKIKLKTGECIAYYR